MNAPLRTESSRPVVLIAEDELHMRLLIERCLRRAGFHTEGVARGDDAVARVARGGIDLVVLDFEMPGLSGPDALRRIRELACGQSLPAVFVTGRGCCDPADSMPPLRVDACFAKPFSPSELAGRISTLLADRMPKPVADNGKPSASPA